MNENLFDVLATDDPGRFLWHPSRKLLTPASNLQGGAALGAAAAAMQATTGRPLIWATAQYLSFAAGTAPVDLQVIVEVSGHQTSQARCIVSRDNREILTAHAALGQRPDGATGVWCTPPLVPPPDACPIYRFFRLGADDIADLCEFRLARGRQLTELPEPESGTVPGDGLFALWIRVGAGRQPMTVPLIAFIGDFLPIGFADALGQPYAGPSLDNTIRIGTLAETEWVLLVTHAQHAAHGFGHGTAELWTQEGTLLGTVSQSVVLRLQPGLRNMAD